MVTPPLLGVLDLSPKRVDGLKVVVVFWRRRKVVLAMVPVRDAVAAAIVMVVGEKCERSENEDVRY